MPGARTRAHSLRDIPGGVWALGFVSMLMDISSEMIHALLPIYLVTVLGTSMVTVGMIEGIAEATASITKIFSGALSDWLGKRKWLAAFGYGLAALTKPMFPLAPTVGWLVAARFIDRVGKGIRGAPRDALVADLAPAHLRGASFGLRQSLDTIGAFAGPLLAIGLMWLTADNFKAVFWFAVIPAFLSLALIIFAVREPDRPAGLRKVRNPDQPCRNQNPRRGLLVGGGGRDGFHAGALQRSLPDLARAGCRHAAHPGARGAGADERGLRRRRVPGRRIVGPRQSRHRSGCRHPGAGRRRYRRSRCCLRSRGSRSASRCGACTWD